MVVMTSIELTAPAKVNLFLKVLGKRKDSYHTIHTLFERISLCDTLTITKIAGGIIVTSDTPVTPRPEDNIAYKAADILLRSEKVACGVKIHIKKRIPVAAGLGGGSSDAAAVLIGINRLLGLGIGKPHLMRIGAQLGADVPFFLLDAPFALGTGRGDRLNKVSIKCKLWHLLIYPGPLKASTKDIYKKFDRYSSGKQQPSYLPSFQGFGSNAKALSGCLTRPVGDATILLPMNWKGLEALLYNDLGNVVAAQEPAIGNIIQCLASSLDKRAIVSGSGPSVFCLWRTRKEAVRARTELLQSVPAPKRKLWRVYVVKTQT